MGANLLTSGIAALIPLVKILYEEAFHENFIFPEDSNETVTFTAGGTVYYRVKCETASATATVHFRYHIHG